ncbi:MAG: FAD:protein FMN transferase [Candidatus Omnitrophota bacterium]
MLIGKFLSRKAKYTVIIIIALVIVKTTADSPSNFLRHLAEKMQRIFQEITGPRAYPRGVKVEKQTRFMMDTYVTISAVGARKITLPAINLALDRMQEIDVKFNRLNPKSPLFAFNHQGVAISDKEIVTVVAAALQVAKDANALFDITVAPLIDLWGFNENEPHLPSQQQIRETLTKVGYEHLSINNGILEKDNPDIAIDLGGIAKGYAVSEAVKVLKASGISAALVDAGGDVYAMGKKGRMSWHIGIQAPRQENLLGYLEIEDLAVMGSGDYERFFMKDGKRYHHILNPKTGCPADELAGITVVYPDPMLADAWATALFVLGPKKGMEIVAKIPRMEVMFVDTSDKIIYSSGLKKILNKIR